MTKITFVRPGGEREIVNAEPGHSVMATAVDNGIDEIVAECGGCLACATCHVYVDEADLDRLPPPSAAEDAMLEATAAPRTPCSRLSCQLKATPELGDLTVHLPSEQY